ncbi:hypothetical protein M2302_005936 [Micromonospora sp. A200]|nr:hypothetical protein [Micromonospora sp. A200]
MLDLVDEVFDVVGAQLVQDDVAEVGDEVHADVGFVAAAGVVVDGEPLQPGGQPVGDSGHPGQWGVGAEPVADGVDVGQGAAGAEGGLQQVADFDAAAAVASGEVEQLSGAVEFVGGLFVGVEAGVA